MSKNDNNTMIKPRKNPHQTTITPHDDYQMYFLVT